MKVKTETIAVSTGKELQVEDITPQVSEAVKESGLKKGIVNIFPSHSTASVSTIEYEPNLVKDLENVLERIAPSDIEYEHHKTWGDRNGKSHVRATVTGPGETVPFRDGKLLLGTWQQLVLLDFDVPARKRKIHLTIIGE